MHSHSKRFDWKIWIAWRRIFAYSSFWSNINRYVNCRLSKISEAVCIHLELNLSTSWVVVSISWLASALELLRIKRFIFTHQNKPHDRERLILAVNSHEIKESERALNRCLGNHGNLIAALKHRACHVFVKCECDLCEVLIFSIEVLNEPAFSYKECILVWITSIFAPKLLEINSAKRSVSSKNRVNLLEISNHQSNLITIAAQWLSLVHVRANIIKTSLIGCWENLWCTSLDRRVLFLVDIRARYERWNTWISCAQLMHRTSVICWMLVFGIDDR